MKFPVAYPTRRVGRTSAPPAHRSPGGFHDPDQDAHHVIHPVVQARVHALEVPIATATSATHITSRIEPIAR